MYCNTPIRWGMIGCGAVTEHKSAPAYSQVERFSLEAVASRTPGKAAEYATRHAISRYYENVEDMLRDRQLDGIYIATPPDSHCHYALEVAKQNKICCIEKPMALNSEECAKVLQAFEQKELPLFVAYYRRSLEGFKQLKSLLAGGAIGRVLQINWQYCRPASELDLSGQPNWRTQSEVAVGGYFDDIGCHGLDLFCYFFGNVVKASGSKCNHAGLYSAADSVCAQWQHDSGVLGTGSWQFNSQCYQDKVCVLGSEGTLECSVFSDSPAYLVTEKTEQRIAMMKPTPIQLPFVQAMRKYLDGSHQHPGTGENAAHVTWIMQQILIAS